MNTRKHDTAYEYMEKIHAGLKFSEVIWALRKCDEISQEDFAKKLGISKSHLCDIEKGRKTVSPERAARFAKILGYPPDQFVSLALQGMLDKAKIKMKVKLEAA
jgi:antitoxin HigA-1